MGMRIRDFAKSVGFDVIGKIAYMGKWDLSTRYYADEAYNLYLVDIVIGGIRIIPSKKSLRNKPQT